MSYAIRKDGQGWRAVNSPSEVRSDETYSDIQPVIAPPINADIDAQIDVLESSVTQRRIREAVLGIDNGWLANVNNQISTLRKSRK